MGSLVLEVLSGPMKVTVGRAQVEQIGLLAPNRPINGLVTILQLHIRNIQLTAVLRNMYMYVVKLLIGY